MNTTREVQLGEAIRRLTAVSSRLAHAYESLKADWLPETPPITIVFSSLGRAICDTASHSSNEESSEIWQTVEDLIVKGDGIVKNAVTTGLLEAILSESSTNDFCISSVAKQFGPATMAYCRAWDEFTGCKTKGIS